MKNSKKIILAFGIIIFGLCFGVLAKAADVAGQGGIFRDAFHAFGLVTSGVFIWAVICTIIVILSPSKISAAINVFLFLAFMILAYYLYSYFVVEYLEFSVVKFWLMMLIPAMIAGYVVWHIKTNRIIKYVVIAGSTVILIIDMFLLQDRRAIIIDVILYVIFLVFILSQSIKRIK